MKIDDKSKLGTLSVSWLMNKKCNMSVSYKLFVGTPNLSLKKEENHVKSKQDKTGNKSEVKETEFPNTF